MLSLEEKACNADTLKHILRVQYYLNMFVKDLIDRGQVHDRSKLESPEVEEFAKLTDNLAGTTFGSKEDTENKVKLAKALEHHYSRNRHHPQHFENGINDMNLLDLIEMFCDWKASSERHNDGNLLKSIDINASRFNLNPQLVQIFKNTVHFVES